MKHCRHTGFGLGRGFLLRHVPSMRNAMPCVGVIVLAGCLTLVVVPDDFSAHDREFGHALSPRLPTVILDAGHGGRDDGARAHGLVEKDLTLDVARRVEGLLQTCGIPTVLTRQGDGYVSLSDRAARANELAETLFVSLHFNHGAEGGAAGVETFYTQQKAAPESAWTWVGFFNRPEPIRDESSEILAGYIHAALLLKTEAPNRGIKARDLFLVRNVRGPAVLVEAGFLSNAFEARLIANPEYRSRLATAIAEGIMSYVRSRPPRPDLLKVAQFTR